MSMQLTINDKNFTLLYGYQKDTKLRHSFNQLVEQVFHFSFEDWYQLGYWNEKYIPYTLFDDEKAVANVSINLMDFDHLGKNKHYLQIGTVMTDEAYRGLGLSRLLMEYVLGEWKDKAEQMYLYANKTVTQMYPKFGFKSVKEHSHYKYISKSETKLHYKKLDMTDTEQRAMLYRYAKTSKSFSQLSMSENADIVMFYCTSFLKDNVFYIEDLDTIAIAQFHDGQALLWDVFGPDIVDLDDVLSIFADNHIDQIKLGFTPLDPSSYEVEELQGEDTLFILYERENPFEENKLMFPLLSHA